MCSVYVVLTHNHIRIRIRTHARVRALVVLAIPSSFCENCFKYTIYIYICTYLFILRYRLCLVYYDLKGTEISHVKRAWPHRPTRAPRGRWVGWAAAAVRERYRLLSFMSLHHVTLRHATWWYSVWYNVSWYVVVYCMIVWHSLPHYIRVCHNVTPYRITLYCLHHITVCYVVSDYIICML